MDLDTALTAIQHEAQIQHNRWGYFHSAHEAYGVALEEWDELWDEIKRKNQDYEAIRREAVHAAAMLIRLIVSL